MPMLIYADIKEMSIYWIRSSLIIVIFVDFKALIKTRNLLKTLKTIIKTFQFASTFDLLVPFISSSLYSYDLDRFSPLLW